MQLHKHFHGLIAITSFKSLQYSLPNLLFEDQSHVLCHGVDDDLSIWLEGDGLLVVLAVLGHVKELLFHFWIS